MKLKPYAALSVAFLMAAHVQAGDLRAEMEAENARWLAAFNSNNPAAFPAMYTKGAIVLPDDGAPAKGREAIERYWESTLKGGKYRDHAFEIVSIQQDGRYAYQVARWTLVVIDDRGERKRISGNTVRIFEHQTDGTWLTKVHIYNSPP
jgi:uncharacterized protein (TIGR02246 family)